MLFEVYTGAKPGRPRLLLFITAGLVIAALGLAWFQVRSARGLEPEQRIGDTPLSVRPPKGWRPDPGNPQRFILPTGSKEPRKAYQRSLRFDFIHLPAFQPVEQLLQLPNLLAGQIVDVKPAQLGPYRAAQVRSIEPIQVGRMRVARETVTRITCLPRGHVLRVVYEPLRELGPADLDIFETVCSTLRMVDTSLNGSPQDYLQRAGLTMPLSPGWNVVGADFAESPAVYIGGSVDDLPAWSIAIFRTWLAGGRTPRDLLADFAAERWLIWDIASLVREERRADEATVTSIRRPRAAQVWESLLSAWVVQQSATQCVIMFIHSEPRYASQANDAAARIASAIEIAPLADIPPLAEAAAAGASLAGDLRKAGPKPRWGRVRVDSTYRCSTRDETVVVQRGARNGNPDQGYDGSLWRRVGRAREDREVWSIDGRAAAYERRAQFMYDQLAVEVIESRERPEGDVSRRVTVEGRDPQRQSFTPGPSFVPPPAESIIHGWVARAEPHTAIIEVSSLLGPKTHTELLRHLPPDGVYPRVLVLRDYWPEGAIEAFDDASAETQYELTPTAEYRRVK